MNTKTISEKKATGSHFTPPKLAEFLSEKLIYILPHDREKIRVLDPACGDGELLAKFSQKYSEVNGADLEIVGVEQNGKSLKKAQSRLKKHNKILIKGNFLEFIKSKIRNALFPQEVPEQLNGEADVIIANPPYVRTQNMGAEKSQELAKAFGLSGKVDLYHAFLIAMTKELKKGGLIGVITSNRFISTKSGKTVREFLERNYEIIELIDLGDTKFFEAAVLPAIFIGRKNQEKTNHGSFRKIYEIQEEEEKDNAEKVNEIRDLLEANIGKYKVSDRYFKVTLGELLIPNEKNDPWKLVTKEEKKWMEKVEEHSTCKIGDVAKVRVGIKTTADSVFIKEDWDDIEETKPEEELLKPILTHEVVGKWCPKKDAQQKTQVLYTHKKEEGDREVIDLKNYPKTKEYLERHRERLEGRNYVIEAGRNWYEIWVPQDPEAWEQNKVVYPDISPAPKFCLDEKGSVVNGDCYWITVEEGESEDWLYLIMAVANSKVMTKYHDLAFNNKLYSGRRRYLTQYVKKYPLPDVKSEEAQKIVQKAKKLTKEQEEKENEIEKLIEKIYGLR